MSIFLDLTPRTVEVSYYPAFVRTAIAKAHLVPYSSDAWAQRTAVAPIGKQLCAKPCLECYSRPPAARALIAIPSPSWGLSGTRVRFSTALKKSVREAESRLSA